MTDRATGERLVLPSRSYALRAYNGLALLGFTALVVAGVWFATSGETRVPLVLVAVVLGGGISLIRAFKQNEDSYRLVIDAKGISAERRGEVVDTAPWKRMSHVEFDSGYRLANWSANGGTGELAQVRCHLQPSGTSTSTTVGVSLKVPAFGRAGLSEIDDALRDACAAHDVEYLSHWTW